MIDDSRSDLFGDQSSFVPDMTPARLISRAEELQNACRPLEGEGMWQESAYLKGYVCELLLKAYIAKRQSSQIYPAKKDFRDHYRHEIKHLIVSACLDQQFDVWVKKHPLPRETNKKAAFLWKPEWRYPGDSPFQASWEKAAKQLHGALFDTDHGIAEWIRGAL